MKTPLLLLFVSACGCAALGGERSVIGIDEGRSARVAEAPSRGSYGLFSSDSRSPILTVILREGEALGFRSSGRGVVAVAGETEVPLEGGRAYDWRRIVGRGGEGNTKE